MASEALDWLAGGAPVAVGVVVEAVGSAPFEPGAALHVAVDGSISGAVTAGIHDAEVAAAAAALLRDDEGDGGARVLELGVTDAQAQDAGLRCGGTVRVFVGRVPETVEGRAAALRAARAEAELQPHAVARALDGPAPGATLHVALDAAATGTLGAGPALDAAVTESARAGILGDRGDLRVHTTAGGPVTVHVAVRPTPRRLYLFGAIDYSRALAALARAVGYDVTLADPRREFGGDDPWSQAAHRALSAHPSDVLAGLRLGPRDAVVVFTHDLALDVPAIMDALEAGAGYVGALGSRRTSERRRARLLELGLAERELERVYAPCGLDLGATDAGESAIAILAEITAVRAGRGGGSLRDAAGPIRA